MILAPSSGKNDGNNCRYQHRPQTDNRRGNQPRRAVFEFHAMFPFGHHHAAHCMIGGKNFRGTAVNRRRPAGILGVGQDENTAVCFGVNVDRHVLGFAEDDGG